MSTEKRRILVVDDEEDLRKLQQLFLEHEGFEVWTACSGKEALEQVQRYPDLILLDIVMPGELSGLEICRQLKTDDRFKTIPIIISSAKVSTQTIESIQHAGADAFLPRPFNVNELLRVLKKHLPK